MSLVYNNYLKFITPSASMNKGLSEVNQKFNLAIGSPDIKPPKEIYNLLQDFGKTPNFNYQPSNGGLASIQNVVNLIDPNNIYLNPDKNVVLTPGAKYGVYLALKTICNLGDNVVLIEPYWLSYPEICNSLGLNFSSWLPRENEYLISDLEELVKGSSSKPKVLILNNPINPSGYIFDEKAISSILQICVKNDIFLVLDEVYKDLTFNSSLALHSKLFSNNLIRIGSFSKSLSIPGFRLGYVFGSEEFISNFKLFHQHIATSISSFSAHIIKKLDSNVFKKYTDSCSAVYKERFDICYDELNSKGYNPLPAEGSFYMLFDVSSFYENGEDACDSFERKGIFMTPGIHYGQSFSSYVRICLTLSSAELKRVIKQL